MIYLIYQIKIMNLLNISFDLTRKPIYRQLAAALRGAIQKGALKPGEALPSMRTLADVLQINRHTVRIAYEELLAEGWIRAEERVAYFVAADFPIEPSPLPQRDPVVEETGVLENILRTRTVHEPYPHENLADFPYNLQSSVPDLRLFPTAELKSCFARGMKQLSMHLDYSGARGDPLLLEVLGKLVRQQRQLLQHELVLTQGSQEAIFMVASLLLKPGSAVAVEEKGYQPAWQCFQHCGAELIPIRLDREGICPDDLERVLQQRPLQLLYLTPLHQYPTTVSLTPARRARVMALLREYKVPLLEDDYDHDVHFDSFPPLPMAADDRDQLVIYVSTLSKLIFPGARLGFMALPRAVVPRFVEMKTFTSRTSETLASRAVALWIEDGGFERHLRRLRRVYQERRDHLIYRLERSSFFRDHTRWEAPKGGMNLWLDLGQHPEAVVERAHKAGLLLSGEHLYLADDKRQHARHLRLGYAAHDEREMNRALGVLEKAMQQRKS